MMYWRIFKGVIALCGFVPLHVSAQLQLPTLDDVVRTVVAPVTAPVETTVRILQGDDPGHAVAGPWQAPGRVIDRGSQVFQQANDVFMRVPGDTIERNLGSDWRRAYNILTATQRVQFELATTSGRYLGGCLQGQGCNVNQLVAGPLAASLRDAYKVYWSHSQPFDDQLVQILSRVVPLQVARTARWVVGNTPDYTVPGFLNSGHRLFGGQHAVTIGNIMIFSTMPDLNTYSDWVWLLHELRHIEQYMSFDGEALESINGFAVDYVQHFNGLENDAVNISQTRAAQLWWQMGWR